MYSFLRIFIVVLLFLALIDWLADRDRRADTDIPNARPEWAVVLGDFKIVNSATANENPNGAVPPGESFLPGDIKYESPRANVRIYFPIVTSIVLSILFTVILRFVRLRGANLQTSAQPRASSP
jgi:hypothetical protein